jgi:protein TonB
MADASARLNNGGRSGLDPNSPIGRYVSPVRDSGLKNFISNIREFLTERPVKVREGGPAVLTRPGFGASLGENLREFFRPAPRGAVRSDLMVNWSTGFGSTWQNLRDLIFPRKLPPLQVTSKPVDVPEIWSKNTQFTRVQALSLAFHVLVLVLIIVPLLPELMSPSTTQAKTIQVTPLDVSPYLPKLPPGNKRAGGGGGGGSHEVLPASKGRLPKFDWTQITPPKEKPPDNPRMAATPTVLGPPDLKLPSPNMPNWGDPLSRVVNDSSGPGSGNGIGSGSGTGVGSGNGAGVGPGNEWGTGGGYPSAGSNGYGLPSCLYCPNPAFTDDAVKAKHQGTVLLSAVITAEGRAIDIHVAQGLGMGLDESAIKAVANWKFKPAIGPNGKPSAVRMIIEVAFRLY